MIAAPKTYQYTLSVYAQYDPTKTLSLRNAFAADMKRRFAELTKVIQQAIVERDCFGLQKDAFVIQQMSPPGTAAFAFPRSGDKVNAFMNWLNEQPGRGILQIQNVNQAGGRI